MTRQQRDAAHAIALMLDRRVPTLNRIGRPEAAEALARAAEDIRAGGWVVYLPDVKFMGLDKKTGGAA